MDKGKEYEERGMLKIGKTYIKQAEGWSYLCADVVAEDKRFTMWFAVDCSHENYLCAGRSDAFVMALLPFAIEREEKLVCEEAMSERLHYQLQNFIIPTITFSGNFNDMIQIEAPLTAERCTSHGATGVVCSDRVNLEYTIMAHELYTELTLTHILFTDIGYAKKAEVEKYDRYNSLKAPQYIEKYKLKKVYINSNLKDVLKVKKIDSYVYWNIACVLAVQGLLAVCIFSSQCSAEKFFLDLNKSSRYAMLLDNCASTESMAIYTFGAEAGSREKWLKQNKISGQIRNMAMKVKKNENVLYISQPYIENLGTRVHLCARVTLYGQPKIIWFSVEASYGDYLTQDRSDAFVIGLFMSAMREGMDIVCEGAVSRRLLYQMNHYLIPIMVNNMDVFHQITIYAKPTDSVLKNAGAVGTGWTGGVDSLFTYMQSLSVDGTGNKLTHLLIANNGALEGKHTRDTLKRMKERAENGFAAETHLNIIDIDSNIQEIVNENFLGVVCVRHAAVALALQKLFKVYYISSDYDFFHFSFDKDNIGYYAWMVLDYFETNNTVLYSSGCAYSRLEKLKRLSDFPMAYRYLHPCIYALKEYNCGKCGKCIRTEAALYAIGALERFTGVFDVEEFKQNKNWYFTKLLEQKNNTDAKEVLELLQQWEVMIYHLKRVGMVGFESFRKLFK